MYRFLHWILSSVPYLYEVFLRCLDTYHCKKKEIFDAEYPFGANLSGTNALALKLIGIEMFGRLLSSVNFSPVNSLRGIENRG